MGFIELNELKELEPGGLNPVGVLGFGNVGMALAQNLRDSGVKVLVSGRSLSSPAAQKALKEKFEWHPFETLVDQVEILICTIPDHNLEADWMRLRKIIPLKTLIVFANGWVPWKYALSQSEGRYGLLAPKGAGSKLRQNYLSGSSLYFCVDWFGKMSAQELEQCKTTILLLAKANHAEKKGILRVKATDEFKADLMSEQLVLCGGLPALIKLASEWMIEKGMPPELAWLECIHEARLIAEMIETDGLDGMYQKISPAAQVGGELRLGEIYEKLIPLRDQIGAQIDSGEFIKLVIQKKSRPKESESF